MRITIAAIGRLKAGPERALCERYLERAGKAGRGLGLTFQIRESPESRATSAAARRSQEASAILAALPTAAVVVTLDGTGQSLTSADFTRRIADWRDTGMVEIVFAIGGPDGLDAAVVDRAGLSLAFGAMTWPHQLVRTMLAEQLYRAVTILCGHPYHRA